MRRVWLRHQRPHQERAHAFIPFFDEEHVFTETDILYPAKAKDIPLPHGGVDIYFAPCLFRRKRRRTEYALPSRWLFADLDESDPRLLKTLMPTVAWETSRGRYQALWELSESLSGDEFLDLNQRVTYYTGADKGGWSSTKVLRVPGSISTKHGDDFKVRLMWWNTNVHDPDRVQRLTRHTSTPRTDAKAVEGLKLPSAPPDRIVRRFKKKLPGRVHKLLKATEARGDRSERLWMLYGDLLDAGMKPEQVLAVVRPTVWNKYAGQKRELKQLWSEVNKAAAAQRGSTAGKKRRSRALEQPRQRHEEEHEGPEGVGAREVVESDNDREHELDHRMQSYNDFLDTKLKRPGWMVESIWSEGAHGVLAGEPKTYKSVISTDLAISVASGTPFLDHFEIPATGPVLMIQEENDPGEFQDRMHRIAHSRGLGSAVHFTGEGENFHLKPNATLPIHVMNNAGFDLTEDRDLTWLSKQCVKSKLALIILDPFYLMTPGVDENSAAQVGPILRRLLALKQQHGVGIQLIHHYRKQSAMAPTEGAQRMSGTGVFHRWFESAVYVETTKDPTTVRLVPDHRGHAAQGAMRVTFDLGEYDDTEYHVDLSAGKADKAQLHHRLRDFMKEGPSDDEGYGGQWTLSDLRIAMGLSNSKQLKAMIHDHDYVMEKAKNYGGRGRPPIIIREMTEKGRKSRFTQAQRRGDLDDFGLASERKSGGSSK